MLIDVVLTAEGLLGLGVAALSGRLRRLPVSEPVLAMAVGVVLGPAVLGILTLAPLTEDTTWVETAARLLLAISVMAVALRHPSTRR